MKHKFKIVSFYIEIAYAKILRFLHFKKDKSVIPEGYYCYVWDEDPKRNNEYHTIPCRFYRSMKNQCYAGCTYVGFIGFDIGLQDQCKICGENEGKLE